MITIATKLVFHIPHCRSLKDKRQVRRSIIDKTKRRFNASIAEVASQDVIQTLALGVAVVSGESYHARQSMDEIVRFMEGHIEGDLISIEFV
jgi:uncharacterized protein YlxP (DUF503 family)